MAKKITKIDPVKQQVVRQLQPKKRVCAYCRVSTDSREQQNSFTAQLEYYTTLIENKEDWQFSGIYADEARSGTKLAKRDDFLRMLKDCEDGKIDMIITKSLTRFARNTVDSIEAIRRLKALGVAVYFEKEHIDSLSEKSELMLTILSSLAQGESESISTNSKWAVIKRFKDGTFILGTPAYGYTKDENGELIIQEEEAAVVRRIFREYLNGKGTYAIAKDLSEQGLPTIRSAEKWNDGVIKEILLNPIYTGNLLHQKTMTTEVLPFKRQINKGQLPQYLVEDNHAPIISHEQAEAVREIFEYRRKQMGVDDTNKYQSRYAFSSRILCGECGGMFRRQKIYIGKPYEKTQWCCRQHILDNAKCSQKAIREDDIQWAFTVMWNKLVSNYTEILTPLLDTLKKLRMNEQQEQEIGECSNKIMELTEQGHILSRLVSKGYIDPAVFIERQNALTIELATVKKKRSQLLDNNGFDIEIAGTEQLLELIRNNPHVIEEYREDLFLQAIDKVIVQKNGQITFRLINRLELSEPCRKEALEDDAKAYAHRI
ncbi:site-specific recombinase, DNA invertase Pin [Desulfitobacterium dichloroeliminans LMG P-21439]|uniref:Site-specific recombinase, DNA invertase Pin n=1 Tax=Desulfitobacterium dichloroeliminans (strain LMG P-21439 / DCA1) TaxID=871963 RepID=L0F794_DESDL|nr:recombinase family protein [Desulfitobacterium dichloroeliminans]AGA68900.1 site-specific recombinase, DNA invertase Pin [Desulfitobacterium dichloroeliminans LMG P-21439]